MGHRAPDVWIQFMPVQFEELQPLSIQEESVEFEPRVAKPDSCPVIVQWLLVQKKGNDEIVEPLGARSA